MFWNPEVITTTGKSLRITQIKFNIIYIMRTNINQGRIQSFWQSHSGFHASALPGISAPLLSPENVADKFYRLPFFCLWMR